MKYSICQLHAQNHPKKNIVSNILKVKTYFTLYCTVNIAKFKQINAGCARETVVSDNKFVFSNWEINCCMG